MIRKWLYSRRILNPHLTLLARINSNKIEDLNVKIEVIKVLEENMGVLWCDQI